MSLALLCSYVQAGLGFDNNEEKEKKKHWLIKRQEKRIDPLLHNDPTKNKKKLAQHCQGSIHISG